jgi:hypothetical protein
VTNSVGRISRGVLSKPFCQHCGKELKTAGRGRPKRFCNDTCRQAGYRDQTGKSSYAGTVRVKTPIPARALAGLPVYPLDSSDKADFEIGVRHGRIIQESFREQCRGIVEVYCPEFGRGILDMFGPFCDMHNLPLGADERLRLLYGPRPNMNVWEKPHCLFRKGWHYLDDWKNLYLLSRHKNLPPWLSWVNPKERIRVRRSREVHINFNVIGAEYDPVYGVYKLTWEPREQSATQQFLTEQTGGNSDAVQPKEFKPNLEHLDSTDAVGNKSTD